MLWGKEFLGISNLYIGVESVLKADFGPKGWDWAGRRLDIWGVGFSHAFEGFLDVFATARPGGFLADIAGYF